MTSLSAHDYVHDPRRLQTLRATGLLDSPAEECFDRLTRLGAEALKVPAAFVSLVDEDRDFYKSSWGFGEPLASSRELSGVTFCHYSLVSDGPLVLSDTRSQEPFASVPTIHSLGILSYVGVPLRTVSGEALGALCVVDTAPRQWTPVEVETLQKLARETMVEIEARLAIVDAVSDVESQPAPMSQNETKLSQLARALGFQAHQEVSRQTIFDHIYDEYSPILYGLLIRILRSESEAQEALQDTFMQAWKQLERFDVTRGPVAAWLIMIARSRGVDRLRQARIFETLEGVESLPSMIDRAPEERIVERVTLSAMSKLIREILISLPAPQRTAIELAYFEGLSHTEIAARLNEPLGTIKTRLLMGMRKIRERIPTSEFSFRQLSV